MLGEKATPNLISKNLAELKSTKISNKFPDRIVIGADSVKKSLLNEGAPPEIISKNLAELKANKISEKKKWRNSDRSRQCYRSKR